MNENIAVRSLLVDKSTGKLIKAIDERDLSDFLPLLTTSSSEKNEVVLYDFAPVVHYFHNELDSKFTQRENKDLAIKRATVFNTWMRLKSVTNEMLLCHTSSQVMRDSEEVLNWIHTRIPDLKNNYYRANNQSKNSYKDEKTEALLKLSDDIEVFIEVLLCNIHATAKVDIESLKSDFVITEHCKSIQKLVFEALGSESSFHNGDFNRNSVIYQICMEHSEINPEALINLLGSSETKDSIKSLIYSKASIEDEWDEYSHTQRKYVVRWPKADPNTLERVKILSKLLEKINLLLVLIEELKSSKVSFEERPEKQEEFKQNIQSLLPQAKT